MISCRSDRPLRKPYKKHGGCSSSIQQKLSPSTVHRPSLSSPVFAALNLVIPFAFFSFLFLFTIAVKMLFKTTAILALLGVAAAAPLATEPEHVLESRDLSQFQVHQPNWARYCGAHSIPTTPEEYGICFRKQNNGSILGNAYEHGSNIKGWIHNDEKRFFVQCDAPYTFIQGRYILTTWQKEGVCYFKIVKKSDYSVVQKGKVTSEHVQYFDYPN
ncbi:hypothetical protein BCV70DRAFT_238712 [Testicularia cyperi]|uniref:Uncharacterized protein n=1 Tax=Testicularia cyperi TaxID=1882483 RepID=A0A317XL49_9BASI|nr:hypothetical protein BCV70DRAFT_238712 [Testicularia cyperi]